MNQIFTTIILMVSLTPLLTPVDSQAFHPTMPDSVYLDSIERMVSTDAAEAKSVLMEEAKFLQNLTANYLVATVKRNVYENLKKMSEEELQSAILAAAQFAPPTSANSHGNSGVKRPKQSDSESDLDPTSVELGTLISGLVFKNLAVIAHVPSILVESVKKSFPGVFGGTPATTPVTTQVTSSNPSGGNTKSRSLNLDAYNNNQNLVFPTVAYNLFETVSHFIARAVSPGPQI